MSKDRTRAKRQAALKNRREAIGFKKYPVWIHKDDIDIICQEVKKLNKKRGVFFVR